MRRFLISASGMLLIILASHLAYAMSADDIRKKSQASFLYQGRDFKARVIMKLVSSGGQE